MKPIDAAKVTTTGEISALYDIYAPALYGCISGMISDRDEAEAVLIKIFSTLSVEMEKYQHRDNLLLWLINLSRNECIARLMTGNEKTKGAPVNDYVSGLPLLEKTIFALVYFKGLDIHEVANLLHLPENRIQGVFADLPKFTTYLFHNIKRARSPVSDILQSLVLNLVPKNDAERVAALKKYKILYTAPEEAFDRITAVIARVFDTPMSFLSLVDKDTVFYKSQVGPFGKSQVNREHSLCSLTVLSREPLIIEDASIATCFKDNPLVQAEQGIKFYAGVPLITSDGYLIGALCVVDTKPRTFSTKDTLLLTEFADIAMREIESRHETFQQALLQEQVKAATR
jgi:GAF domain-containing protein